MFEPFSEGLFTDKMEWWSASRLARAIRDRDTTSLEATEHFIARIQRLDPQFNLVVVKLFDQARARAREADAAIDRGESWGPLHGVPMTIKEAFSIKGVLTTAGWDRLKTHRPKADAVVVSKLLGAGAVLLGKTNVPLLCGDFQSYNAIYGTSNNPWSLQHSPGGSSGGSAGALAMGFTPLEVGSDIGGSIRSPAHCCGVFGLKPTLGVVDSEGHVPPAPFVQLKSNLYVVGPMARGAEDLALLYRILAGPRAQEAPGWRLVAPPPRPKPWRIAVCTAHESIPTDEEVSRAVRGAADSLSREPGVTVVWEALPPALDVDEALGVYQVLINAEMAGVKASLSHGDYLRNEQRRGKLRQAWASFFQAAPWPNPCTHAVGPLLALMLSFLPGL